LLLLYNETAIILAWGRSENAFRQIAIIMGKRAPTKRIT